jgi:hypothetical protein
MVVGVGRRESGREGEEGEMVVVFWKRRRIREDRCI